MLKIFEVIYMDKAGKYYTMELVGYDYIDVKTTWELNMNILEDYEIYKIKYISDFIKKDNQ